MRSRNSCYSAIILAGLVMSALGCDGAPVQTTGNMGGMGGSSSSGESGGMGGLGGTGGLGGLGGLGGSGGSSCLPMDDLKECTDDVCDMNAMPVNTPKAMGEPCSTGQCDGNGECVECLAPADCPGTDDTCQTRTCVVGICGMDFAAEGTTVPEQTVGDCKNRVCDGNGGQKDENYDLDTPDDNNACTGNVCTMGVPSNPTLAQGTNCTPPGSMSPLVCNAMGQCVGCNVAADCPGKDDECGQRTCNAGVCGQTFTAKDTPVMSQTTSNCLVHVCDGNGNFVDIPDNADVPLDDGNVCTLETCAAGMPMHPNAANGASCNDGSACTQADTCQMGVCMGANPVTCTASDQCHDVGTCNPATGTCSNPVKVDGAFCNDGNSCTQNDTCTAGTCTGANPVTCTASDQCHDAGVCNPMTGICSNPNKTNGAACNDSNACTQSDTCQMGVCTGANPITCSASDQCHNAGTCDPMTGMCSNPNKANGTACNDSNACTQSDTCQTGVCTGANPVMCMASDQCHATGTCNTTTGMCSNPNAPNGTMCTLSGSPGVCAIGACTLCGNSTINAGEQCDDGNSVSGDGCNSNCQYEEVEPNNTCAVANTLVLSGSPLAGSILGAITPIGDQDWYSFTIPAPSPRSVKIETNIGGVGQCTAATGSADTEIFLYASNCTSLLGSDDEDGFNSCSLINPVTDPFARSLLPGTYKVRTIRFNNSNVINQYVLSVSVVGTCGNNIVEPGEACDDGNLNPGDGCNGTCGVENGFTCSGSPSVCFPNEINCNDGLDNNGSGAADAADPSCAIPAYFPACAGGQHLLVYPMPAEIAIPVTPAVLNSNITVSGATQVARAAIVFNATHPYDGDVDLRLTAPGGTVFDMCTGNGSVGDHFINMVLDSTCATNVTVGTAPFTGCYAPEQSLASLNGTPANGLWQLNLNDNAPAADFGTFNGWKLVLCTSP